MLRHFAAAMPLPTAAAPPIWISRYALRHAETTVPLATLYADAP